MTDTPLTEASFYILISLARPLHGYGVIKKVEEMSAGRVILGPGTLYGALTSMVKKRWIEPVTPSSGGERRKMYRLTLAGRAVIDSEVRRLDEVLTQGRAALTEGETCDVQI